MNCKELNFLKIEKIVVLDDEGNLIEFPIKDGVGIFITEDDKRLVLPSINDSLNMEIVRSAIMKWQ